MRKNNRYLLYAVLFILLIVLIVFVVRCSKCSKCSNESYAFNPWVNGGFCQQVGSSCYYYPDISSNRQTPYLGTESNSSARDQNPITNCNGMLACSWTNYYMKWLAEKQLKDRPAHFSDAEYDQLPKQIKKYAALDPNGVSTFDWITPKPVEVVSKKGPPQNNPRSSPVRA